jgi:hypothetical protein
MDETARRDVYRAPVHHISACISFVEITSKNKYLARKIMNSIYFAQDLR